MLDNPTPLFQISTGVGLKETFIQINYCATRRCTAKRSLTAAYQITNDVNQLAFMLDENLYVNWLKNILQKEIHIATGSRSATKCFLQQNDI